MEIFLTNEYYTILAKREGVYIRLLLQNLKKKDRSLIVIVCRNVQPSRPG